MFFARFRTRRLEKQRNIFSFWDGQRVRRVDPLAVLQTLQSDKDFLLDKHIRLALDLGDAEAIRITTQAVHRAFGVWQWSDGKPGLTIAEQLALVTGFVGWLEALKKNTEDWPTIVAPLEPTSEESATRNTSDCVSTSIESKPARQPAY